MELSRNRTLLVWAPNSITVFVVFGQYCLSLSAIISIIKRDKRLLDGCFGKLKRLSICIMSSIFNLNAKFWPKNWPKNLSFLKKCFHTLWRHHDIPTRHFWGLFLHFLTVQTNIYQTMASNKHHLKRFSSYIQLKRSSFAVCPSMHPNYLVPWQQVRRECALFMKLLWNVVCYKLLNVRMKIWGPCQGFNLLKCRFISS